MINLIRPGALGDTICVLPAARALKDATPGLRIRLVGGPFTLPVARLAGECVDETLRFDDTQLLPLFASGEFSKDVGPRLERMLKADLTVACLSRPGLFEANWGRYGGGSIVSVALEEERRPGEHVSEVLWRRAARAMGIEQTPTPLPSLVAPGESRRRATRWLTEAGIPPEQPFLAVHPGSGSRAKCWPPNRFAQLITEVGEHWKVPVVVLEGPADQWATRELRKAEATIAAIASSQTLEDMAALLELATVYIGNDSGISHLAAALDVPTVALFGPTDAVTWAPQGPRVHVLLVGADCRPCTRSERAGCGHRVCLTGIEPARALAVLSEYLMVQRQDHEKSF